jgi:hypothetical protein
MTSLDVAERAGIQPRRVFARFYVRKRSILIERRDGRACAPACARNFRFPEKSGFRGLLRRARAPRRRAGIRPDGLSDGATDRD